LHFQLNIPLEGKDLNLTEAASERMMHHQLLPDPNILKEKGTLKLLAHPSGAVYLFQLSSDEKELYRINLLHHNKTISSICSPKRHLSRNNRLHFDVCLYSNGRNKNLDKLVH